MALSDAQAAQVFEIFGVPQGGRGEVVASVATLFGPAWESYDLAGVVTLLNERLAALTAAQETRVAALLVRWDAIGSTSPLKVDASAPSHGTLADHPAERAALRLALADLIGFAAPSGGFAAEARRVNCGPGVIR